MAKPIRSGWSSRPVTKGEFDIEELVYEEVLDDAGVPVAFVIDTMDADGNAYAEQVRSAIIDIPVMLDLLQEARDGFVRMNIGTNLIGQIDLLMRKHGRG